MVAHRQACVERVLWREVVPVGEAAGDTEVGRPVAPEIFVARPQPDAVDSHGARPQREPADRETDHGQKGERLDPLEQAPEDLFRRPREGPQQSAVKEQPACQHDASGRKREEDER